MSACFAIFHYLVFGRHFIVTKRFSVEILLSDSSHIVDKNNFLDNSRHWWGINIIGIWNKLVPFSDLQKISVGDQIHTGTLRFRQHIKYCFDLHLFQVWCKHEKWWNPLSRKAVTKVWSCLKCLIILNRFWISFPFLAMMHSDSLFFCNRMSSKKASFDSH